MFNSILWALALEVPLSMEFPRQQYWSGLPCPPSEDLPDSEIESMSHTSPALASRFFTTSATWEAPIHVSILPQTLPCRLSHITEQSSLCYTGIPCCFSSVQFSRSVMSNSLRPHESQHARPPCPSPNPGVHSDSRPSSQ